MLFYKAAAIAITQMAVFYDYRTYRIPNWLNMYGLISTLEALAAYIIFGIAPLSQVIMVLCGFAIMLAVSIPVYVVGGIGAGDVKLLAVLGGMLGYKQGIKVLVMSMLIAAIYGMVSVAINADNSKKKGFHRIHFTYAIFAAVIINIA